MKIITLALNLIILSAASVDAFLPIIQSSGESQICLRSFVGETPYFLDEATPPTTNESTLKDETLAMKAEQIKTESKPKVAKTIKKVADKGKHTEGIFSPLVYALKGAMGKDKFLKVRGKVISLHSGVIKDFVDTYDTNFGMNVLVKLFAIADKDGNGSIDKEELALAFETLGFSWLKEKETEKIFDRADKDKNGQIDFDEFVQETPKTLKTHLVKLAKKNGDEMGFLV